MAKMFNVDRGGVDGQFAARGRLNSPREQGEDRRNKNLAQLRSNAAPEEGLKFKGNFPLKNAEAMVKENPNLRIGSTAYLADSTIIEDCVPIYTKD